MKPVFNQTESLDKKCYKDFLLSEDILMENASNGMKNFILKRFKKPNTKILIIAGGGNNGADGITLARQLFKLYKTDLYLATAPFSDMAKLQLQRANRVGIKDIKSIKDKYDIIVDAIFGSGLSRQIDNKTNTLIKKINSFSGYKIACDIPSGIFNESSLQKDKQKSIFQAHTTITMGALKSSLFSCFAKNFTGNIKVCNLGVSNKVYENKTNIFYLQKSDLVLPTRNNPNTNKSSFGHSCVVTGFSKEAKIGAGILAIKSAINLGSGLGTIIGNNSSINEPEIMTSQTIPTKCNAIAIGMGLGHISKSYLQKLRRKIQKNNIQLLLDADMFYIKDIHIFLDYPCVLTPHPKEFISLLKITKIANITISKLEQNRFHFIKLFCKKYKNIVLLLKGSNTLIGLNKQIFINSWGKPSLSKAGSGDVLAGAILAYLSQGYSLLNASLHGSLAHSLASRKYKKNSYGLTPFKLIKQFERLKTK